MSDAYAIAADVAWVSDEFLDDGTVPTAYITTLPDGPAVVLQGPACLVWLALAESSSGTLDDITALVADVAETDAGDITADVEQLLQGLVAQRVATLRA